MDDRYDEIFRQYDFKIYNTYRARGAFILETNHGIKLFKSFEGSKNHVEFENRVKEYLYEQDYKNVDLFVRNKQGEIISYDTQENGYVIKDWFLGEACNLREKEEIMKAASNLGKLHSILKNVPISEPQDAFYQGPNLIDIFEKHNRELKRVRSYIREKRQKNEFEMCFINVYDYFYETGLVAHEKLVASNYLELLHNSVEKCNICHGNYTYHNVLSMNGKIATTNFDKCQVGVQVTDLYFFLRKVMEKNDWNQEWGLDILKEYNKNNPLNVKEQNLLYILLLYPEKFWKITNFYYNGKKSWVPQRNIQKLISLEEQTKVKESFLTRMELPFLPGV